MFCISVRALNIKAQMYENYTFIKSKKDNESINK